MVEMDDMYTRGWGVVALAGMASLGAASQLLKAGMGSPPAFLLGLLAGWVVLTGGETYLSLEARSRQGRHRCVPRPHPRD